VELVSPVTLVVRSSMVLMAVTKPVVDATNSSTFREISSAISVMDEASMDVLVLLVLSLFGGSLISGLLLLGGSSSLGELSLSSFLLGKRLICLSSLLLLLVSCGSRRVILGHNPVVNTTNDSSVGEFSNTISAVVETTVLVDLFRSLGFFLLLFLLLFFFCLLLVFFSLLKLLGISSSLSDLGLTSLLLLQSLVVVLSQVSVMLMVVSMAFLSETLTETNCRSHLLLWTRIKPLITN